MLILAAAHICQEALDRLPLGHAAHLTVLGHAAQRERAAKARLVQAASAAAEEKIVSTVVVAGDPSSPLPQRAQTAVVDYTLWINDFDGQQIDTSNRSQPLL